MSVDLVPICYWGVPGTYNKCATILYFRGLASCAQKKQKRIRYCVKLRGVSFGDEQEVRGDIQWITSSNHFFSLPLVSGIVLTCNPSDYSG